MFCRPASGFSLVHGGLAVLRDIPQTALPLRSGLVSQLGGLDSTTGLANVRGSAKVCDRSFGRNVPHVMGYLKASVTQILVMTSCCPYKWEASMKAPYRIIQALCHKWLATQDRYRSPLRGSYFSIQPM